MTLAPGHGPAPARPWLRPPRLRSAPAGHGEDERHASWLEVACLWWVYFDAGVGGDLSSRTGSMQLFTRVHIPLLAALTAVGAGVQLLIEEAARGHLDAGAAWALDGGAALYLLCLTVVQRAAGRADVGARARALTAVALLALAVAAGVLTPVALTAASAAALLVLVVVEVRRGLAVAAGSA